MVPASSRALRTFGDSFRSWSLLFATCASHGISAQVSTDIVAPAKTSAVFCCALRRTATSRACQYGACGSDKVSFQSSQTQIAVKSFTGAKTAARVPTTMLALPRSTESQLRYLWAGPSSAAKIATADFGQPSATSDWTTRSIAARSGTTTITFPPLAETVTEYCASKTAASSQPVVTTARGASPAIVRLINAAPPV